MDEDEIEQLLAPPEIPRDMVVRTLGLKRAIEVLLQTKKGTMYERIV